MKIYLPIKAFIFLTFFIYVTSSCENDIPTINKVTNAKELPVFSTTNFEMLYSDMGKVKMKLTAKLANKYDNIEKQYLEFPEGLVVYQYDTALNIVTTITANYAIYHENTKLWEARNNVIINSITKNEQLYTEELFWDSPKAIIYSSKFTKIIKPGNVVYSEQGFESKDDMSKYKLFNGKGKITINDTLNEE